MVICLSSSFWFCVFTSNGKTTILHINITIATSTVELCIVSVFTGAKKHNIRLDNYRFLWSLILRKLHRKLQQNPHIVSICNRQSMGCISDGKSEKERRIRIAEVCKSIHYAKIRKQNNKLCRRQRRRRRWWEMQNIHLQRCSRQRFYLPRKYQNGGMKMEWWFWIDQLEPTIRL